MSGDPSAARARSAGFRTGAGGGPKGKDRTDATEPVPAGARGSATRPAVKDVPVRPADDTSSPPVAEPVAPAGRPGASGPTEVYDQVRREWVTVGGAATDAVETTPETGAVVTAVPQAGAGTARKARLVVSTVDPWSVMKISFVLSLAGAIILLVVVWLMWLLLSNGGVFTSVDQTVGDIAGSSSSISIIDIFSLRRVMGVALMLAVVQVVLVTALATLGAFLYNLASGLVGGLDVTLAEDR